MMDTWVLVANASAAKLYTSENLRHNHLVLLDEYSHPDSRKKRTELISDRPGSYEGRGICHGTFVERSDPKEVEAEHFAQELASKLNSGRNSNSYEKLLLIASPHFQGLLKKHMDAKVSQKVTHVIEKDYTKIPEKALVAYIHTHLGLVKE